MYIIKAITILAIAAASVASIIGVFMILGGVGGFDYSDAANIRLTSEEEAGLFKKIYIGLIIAIVSTLIAVFQNRINQAIDRELQRRYTARKRRADARLAARLAESADYKDVLRRYGGDVTADNSSESA